MIDVIITIADVTHDDEERPYALTKVLRFDYESVEDVQMLLTYAHRFALAGGMMENSLNGSTSEAHDELYRQDLNETGW